MTRRLYIAPQLLFAGMVELGPLVGVMVMLPVPIGLIASLIGLLSGMVMLARRRLAWPSSLMLLGQAITWGLAIAIIVWAARYGTTGWELLALPASLMFGQLVVGAGLAVTAVRRVSAATDAPLR